MGRAWVAIREDEDAAEIMGVPTFRFKLWAFAIGAAIGGLVRRALRRPGRLREHQTASTSDVDPVPRRRGARRQGNKVGGVISARLLSGVHPGCGSRAIAEYKYLFFGVALMVLMIFRPQGLLGAADSAAARAADAGTSGCSDLRRRTDVRRRAGATEEVGRRSTDHP